MIAKLSETEQELHEHYARNAKARGHEATCDKVTVFRNWPTLLGRPACTCGHGGR